LDSLHKGSSFGREGLIWALRFCSRFARGQKLRDWDAHPDPKRFDRAIKQNISELNCPKEEPVCRLGVGHLQVTELLKQVMVFLRTDGLITLPIN